MKANELRIGNLVHANNVGTHPSNSYLEPHTIADGKDIENAMWYFPIPLTEEWLLKFGFKKNRLDDAYWYTKSSGKHKPQLITNDIGEDAYAKCLKFVFLDGYDNIRVKHVHQLQNLYYALTGEELTIKTK